MKKLQAATAAQVVRLSICSPHNVFAIADAAGNIQFRSLETGKLIREMSLDDECTALAFSADASRLAIGCVNGKINIWTLDAPQDKEIVTLAGHAGQLTALEFGLDGSVLASGGADKSVRLWDAERGTAGSILNGHHHAITALAFGSNSFELASASLDPGASIWTNLCRLSITAARRQPARRGLTIRR